MHAHMHVCTYSVVGVIFCSVHVHYMLHCVGVEEVATIQQGMKKE